MREKQLLKIFAVSDIHGHLTVLKRALSDAGFKPNFAGHLLLVLGDIFDRGRENRALLDFLDGISNKVMLYGNHDGILLDALCTHSVGRLQTRNGTDITISEFFPSYIDNGVLVPKTAEDRASYNRLMGYIGSLSFLFETDHYIFTHGWLPMDDEGIAPDYEYTRYGTWDYAAWQRWYNFYGKFDIPKGKTLVVGHSSAVYGVDFDEKRSESDYSTFFGERFIAIDGTVPRSGRINVLVIEDTVDMPETYDVGTEREGLDEILKGGKRVFLELFTPDMRQIKVGDIFEITDGRSTHRRRVTSLHAYSTFAQLEDDFESYELGFGYDRYPGYLAGEMRKLYRFEDVVEYGAIAIVTAPID